MRARDVAMVGVALAMLAAACSGPSTAASLPDRPTEPLETAVESTTWTAPGGDDWPLEVAYPVAASDDEWPVLVSFHGWQAGTSLGHMGRVASEGVVVVAPRWNHPDWNPSNPLDVVGTSVGYAAGEWYDAAGCALAAAQALAEDHGGDPRWTTVEGFSAGVHPAGWVGLGLATDERCPGADWVSPVGLVVGDLQYLFQAEMFDDAFVDADPVGRSTVDGFLNPDRWDVPDDLQAYVWSTRDSAMQRRVDSPPAADSWLRKRSEDPNRLVADLNALGAFDDGFIRFDDNGPLLALRLAEAEIEVLHEGHDRGHSFNEQVYDRIADVVWREELVASG